MELIFHPLVPHLPHIGIKTLFSISAWSTEMINVTYKMFKLIKLLILKI